MESVIASIIVPVHNAEKFLNKCIDSLLNQTFSDYEIILVDDGSTDNSGKICDTYSSDKVRVFHQESCGVSAARNLGIYEAKGQYILFCDSDDYVSNSFVETVVEGFNNYKTDLVITGYIRNNTVRNKLTYYTFDDNPVLVNRRDFLELSDKILLAAVWNKAFKKSIIDDNNIHFILGLQCAEDLLFVLDYINAMSCHDILTVPQCNYYYIMRKGSTAFTYFPDLFSSIITPEFNKIEYMIRLYKPHNKKLTQEFYTSYHLKIVNSIKNTFDKRNKSSILKKLLTCSKAIHSIEYKRCFKNMNKSHFTPLYLNIFNTRCTLFILLFLKITDKK